MDVDWPAEFGTWLDHVENDARAGDQRSRTILVFVARALDQLRNLPEPPSKDSELATLRWADLLVPAGHRHGGRRVVRRR